MKIDAVPYGRVQQTLKNYHWFHLDIYVQICKFLIQRFECPERLENGPDVGCQYRGRIYKVGESISEQFMPKRCDAECTCENWIDKK